jgi:hypothetical protein
MFWVLIVDKNTLLAKAQSMGSDYLIWIVAVFGLTALVCVFRHMEPGFGPFNLRVVGIVVVATFATLLGLKDNGCGGLTAAMGILGGIAGYVFGIRNTRKQEEDEEK